MPDIVTIEGSISDRIAQILTACVAGDLVVAQHLAADLGPLRSAPILRSAAAGRRPVAGGDGLFVIGADEPGLLAHCRAICTDLSTFLDMPPPLIAIVASQAVAEFALTHTEAPGFAVIIGRAGGTLWQTARHELAHAFLSCNSLLLSEGFAYWYDLPDERRPILRDLDPRQVARLLVYDKSAGLLFDGTAEGNDEATAIGQALIDRIVNLGGVAALRRVFAAWDAAPNQPDTIAQVLVAAGLADDRAAIARAWQCLQRDFGAADFLERLTGHIADLDIGDRTADRSAVLAQLALTHAHAGLAQGRLADLAGLAARVEDAADTGVAGGRLSLLRAQVSVLKMLRYRHDHLRLVTESALAVRLLQDALAKLPHDAQVAIWAGLFAWRQPAEFGGDRAHAASLLQSAMQDEAWGAYARHVYDSLTGVAVPMPTENPAPGTPVRVQFAAITVCKSDQFTLAIDGLAAGGGDLIGIIGPNGAGKTVLIETLLGFNPSGGADGQVLGIQAAQLAARPDIKRQLGVHLQGTMLPAMLTVGELVDWHYSLYRLKSSDTYEALQLGQLARAPYRFLSFGQKQRVHLFMALAHDPALAILDEPTLGLDDVTARQFRDLLQARRAAGRTTLISSHIAADLRHCDRVLCLAHGRIHRQGRLADLLAREIGPIKGRIDQALSDAALADLAALDGLAGPPIPHDGGVIAFGNQAFARSFRHFIDRHAIAAYACGSSDVDDLLARLAQLPAPALMNGAQDATPDAP